MPASGLTPQQFLYGMIASGLAASYPEADPAGVVRLATNLSTMWVSGVIPNLRADLVTGEITLVVLY